MKSRCTPRPAGPKPIKSGATPYRREKLPRRNELCPCGSGKKAKKCCLNKIKFLASLPPHLRELVVADKILKGSLLRPSVPLVIGNPDMSCKGPDGDCNGVQGA
jgi:hypothetical protein